MSKSNISWERIDNGNYVRIDELKGCDKGNMGSPLAICVRQISFGRGKSFEVWAIRYVNGSAGDDNTEVLFESKNDENTPSHDWVDSAYLKSDALKYATAKRNEYLKLLRHLEVSE